MKAKAHQRPTSIFRFVYFPSNEEHYEIYVGTPKYTQRRQNKRKLSTLEANPIIQDNSSTQQSSPDSCSTCSSSPTLVDQGFPQSFDVFIPDYLQSEQPPNVLPADPFQDTKDGTEFYDPFQESVDPFHDDIFF